jgi:hypothetical protein
MTTDNFCFYLQNRLIQTSQTGGQRYSDSIPCLVKFFRTSPGKGDFDSRNGVVPDFPERQDSILLPQQVDLDRVIQNRVSDSRCHKNFLSPSPRQNKLVRLFLANLSSLYKRLQVRLGAH